MGDEPDLGHSGSRGPRPAPLDGFDLHANVWVPPNDRGRLEPLDRSLLRPFSLRQLRPDGRVLVALNAIWRDGTSHLLFDPMELLETLAALIARPAVDLVLYRGVLASHARWRPQGVTP